MCGHVQTTEHRWVCVLPEHTDQPSSHYYVRDVEPEK